MQNAKRKMQNGAPPVLRFALLVLRFAFSGTPHWSFHEVEADSCLTGIAVPHSGQRSGLARRS
jgi:hypothetical protein